MVTDEMAKAVEEMLEQKRTEARKAVERASTAGPYFIAYNQAAKSVYALGEACRQLTVELLMDDEMTDERREAEAHNAAHNLIQLLAQTLERIEASMPCLQDKESQTLN